MHEDQELEAYLRQFKPRTPSAHVTRAPSYPTRRFLFLAAAAVLVLGGIVSVWPTGGELKAPQERARHASVGLSAPPLTAGGLRRTAVLGPVALDLSLEASEPHTLVLVDRLGGQLQTLAKQ